MQTNQWHLSLLLSEAAHWEDEHIGVVWA